MRLLPPSFILFFASLVPFSAAADEVLPYGKELLKDPYLENATGPTGILMLLDRIATWIFAVFIGIAIILILLAAFKYLTSGGGEDTSKAHKQLVYAAIAVAVAVLAKSIVTVVRIIVTDQPVPSTTMIILPYEHLS